MAQQQSWSVVIFCYNESGTITSVIDSVHNFLNKINCTQSEIIIVDDGSKDGSVEKIKEAEKRYPNIKAIYHPKNLGIGQALKSGYFNAQYENITAVPADGQFDVNELIPFFNIDLNTFISFYRKENTIYSLQRNILSYFNKKVNSIFMGIDLRDVNWVKIYKREAIVNLDLRLKSSLIESEICSKLLIRKNRAIETISVYHQRKSGVSKGASTKVVVQALKETIKLIFVIFLFRLNAHKFKKDLK